MITQRKHKAYLDKLIEKKIKILPCEEYKGAKNIIAHKCICGNKWNISPARVLQGNNCTKCKKDLLLLKYHKKYVEALKNIEVYIAPLEVYKGIGIKILHKCVCGNEWNVSPRKVLIGQQCGHDRIHNHQDYLNKLKENNIEVYPIDTYKFSKIKILHKCICGNTWNVTPIGVLQGNKCGCRKRLSLRDEKFYKDKHTILYYVQIEDLFKIGVTLFKDSVDKSIKKRFSKTKVKILHTKVFNDGSEAFRLEQSILNSNRDLRYYGEDVLPSGNTELFIKDIRIMDD